MKPIMVNSSGCFDMYLALFSAWFINIRSQIEFMQNIGSLNIIIVIHLWLVSRPSILLWLLLAWDFPHC